MRYTRAAVTGSGEFFRAVFWGEHMGDADPSLLYWSWFFLAIYIGLMIFFGVMGMRRVKSGDDFATARGAYGPIFLSFALTATAASGGTFLGLPALAYKTGFSCLWYAFVYPVAAYLGVLMALKMVRRAGANFGNRSTAEYLGDRFQSDALRVLVSVFSLLLLFYLAAQLLSGAVMFNRMMGVDILPALAITGAILLIYIVIGGAHADILTDGVQGALMLVLAILVAFLFFTGFNIEGGFSGMVSKLEAIDPALVQPLHPTHPLLDSWWDVFAIFITHAPIGMLPHIGNKLWALRSDRDQVKFIVVSFIFGMILPALTFGGILARAILGDALLVEGASANDAIPMLFIATMPAWLAGLIGAGVLAAVMSTADGLVVSTSQIFANDIYRRTIAPRLKSKPSDEVVDRMSLKISRIATVGVMIGAAWLAFEAQTMNVALLIWAGVGGMMAAMFGPLFCGILWRGATRAGAIAGFVAGGAVFIVLKAQWLEAAWFVGTIFETQGAWLAAQGVNPFACATIGSGFSLLGLVVVSKFTQAPDSEHLDRMFEEPVPEGAIV
ncbi:MAG: sodium:solute symporter family protein [Pseudomonadota bacterium]